MALTCLINNFFLSFTYKRSEQFYSMSKHDEMPHENEFEERDFWFCMEEKINVFFSLYTLCLCKEINIFLV